LKISEDDEQQDASLNNRLIQEVSRGSKPEKGLSTGLAQFDLLSGGLSKGTLNVFASRPSMGKTSLACNFI
jgi:replicative DNA helicase